MNILNTKRYSFDKICNFNSDFPSGLNEKYCNSLFTAGTYKYVDFYEKSKCAKRQTAFNRSYLSASGRIRDILEFKYDNPSAPFFTSI